MLSIVLIGSRHFRHLMAAAYRSNGADGTDKMTIGKNRCHRRAAVPAGQRRLRTMVVGEGGATKRELMALNGWNRAAVATRYTRKANQRSLAGRAAEKLTEQKLDKTVPPKPAKSSGGDK